MTDPGEAIGRLVGEPANTLRRLGAAVFLMAVQDGRLIIAKRGAGPGASAAEAAGLRWLGEHGDLPVPTVRGNDGDWIVSRRRSTASASAPTCCRPRSESTSSSRARKLGDPGRARPLPRGAEAPDPHAGDEEDYERVFAEIEPTMPGLLCRICRAL